jgi:hypothetical protein
MFKPNPELLYRILDLPLRSRVRRHDEGLKAMLGSNLPTRLVGIQDAIRVSAI